MHAQKLCGAACGWRAACDLDVASSRDRERPRRLEPGTHVAVLTSMRTPWLALSLLVTACTPTATEVSLQALDPSGSVLMHEGARALLRGPPSVPLAQSDERASFEVQLQTPQGIVPAPGRVLRAVLVLGGAAWVLADGTLERDDGTFLDDHVLPELSVSRDGRSLAYAREQVEGGGVRIVDLETGERRAMTARLGVADRPLLLDDGRLIVVGSVPGGVAGVWIIDVAVPADTRALTNQGLRAGRPFGEGFVPPPAFHASMRVENGVLVYDDGRREQRITLPARAS